MTPVLQLCPSPRELDDLELLVSGALAPIMAFNEASSPVTLDLPDDAGDEVELVDPEGLPLARVEVATGKVRSLTHPQFGPFRRLYLGPEQVREHYAGRTFVPVTDALTVDQLDRVASAGPVVLLALVGHGTPELSPVGLIRACLALASPLDAAVVAVPLASHDDPEVDHALGAAVVAAYAGDDPVLGLADDDSDYVAELSEILEQERPGPDRQGLVLFFTGLSGSGKSTLARAVMDRLLEQGGRSVTSLDGDVVRRHLSAGLTFSKEDRETNIRRIGWVAAEITRHGGVAVCSPIAPFDQTRQQVREMVESARGAFFLVHVATPLEECERRDRKGLYVKARRGEIPEFTGISSPYEEPQDADVRVDTTGRTIEEALNDVIAALADAGYLDLRGFETPVVEKVAPELSVVEEVALATVSKPGEPDAGHETGASAPSSTNVRPVIEEVAPAPGQSVVEEVALATVTKPGDPTDHRPLHVLFVCTANICRSPYMELTARGWRAPPRTIEFTSAGTHGFRRAPDGRGDGRRPRDPRPLVRRLREPSPDPRSGA